MRRRGLRLTPRNAPAQPALGDVLAEQGRLSEAARAYSAALALDPSDLDAKSKLEHIRAAS